MESENFLRVERRNEALAELEMGSVCPICGDSQCMGNECEPEYSEEEE